MNTKQGARVGPARKRILVVDDHPIFREGLLQSINRQPDLVVCGEAENAQQALTAVRTLKPDLVLVDISIPGKSGFELVKDIQALHP
jgi:DNA-binding NarL/FixJ family response regulator